MKDKGAAPLTATMRGWRPQFTVRIARLASLVHGLIRVNARSHAPVSTHTHTHTQAIILADVDLSAQTLYPLTHDLPKSLLPLANRPLLQYQLDLLQAAGFAGQSSRRLDVMDVWGGTPDRMNQSLPRPTTRLHRIVWPHCL